MIRIAETINLYEELGLDQTASVEQIHQAYKRLARLLHPDQCADENLRGLAETQMKRLNHILAVLTDPERRRAYDASLVVHDPPATSADDETYSPARRTASRPVIVWSIAGVAGAILLASVLWTQRYTPPDSVAAVAAPKPVNPVAPPPPRKDARYSLAVRPHSSPPASSAPDELPDQPGPNTVPRSQEYDLLAGGRASETTPDQHSEPAEPDPPPLRSRDRARFAGTWLYARAAEPRRADGLYPPEFIELCLMEEGGVVRGRYRLRYAIPDQAISPIVNFQFEGPIDSPRLPWEGPSGARGEVSLKLLPDGQLEVRWTARHISPELALTSGTATLIRDSQPQ